MLINHRINTIKQLKETPMGCGVEVDLRQFNNQIILQHDPFKGGILFEEFLKYYNHSFIILNIKSEGIEKEVFKLIKLYNIKDYFFLDVSFPNIIKLVNDGVHNIAVRCSEYECLQTALNLKGKVDWIFIDNFNYLPLHSNRYQEMTNHFKLCIVSPELCGRKEIQLTKHFLTMFPVDAVLTNNIVEWKS